MLLLVLGPPASWGRIVGYFCPVLEVGVLEVSENLEMEDKKINFCYFSD